MDPLQKLLDIEDIKNLKHRYFRAIDMADFDLLDNIFTEDVTVDYRGGTYRWESQGKKTITESLRHSFHSQACAMHTGHHPEIEIISAPRRNYRHPLALGYYLGNTLIVRVGVKS
jgi:hypothetical protein